MNRELDELREQIERRDRKAREAEEARLWRENEGARLARRISELEGANAWYAEQITKWETASGLETNSGDPEGVKPEHAQRYREELERRVVQLEKLTESMLVASKLISEFGWAGIPTDEFSAATVDALNGFLVSLRAVIAEAEVLIAKPKEPTNGAA